MTPPNNDIPQELWLSDPLGSAAKYAARLQAAAGDAPPAAPPLRAARVCAACFARRQDACEHVGPINPSDLAVYRELARRRRAQESDQ